MSNVIIAAVDHWNVIQENHLCANLDNVRSTPSVHTGRLIVKINVEWKRSSRIKWDLVPCVNKNQILGLVRYLKSGGYGVTVVGDNSSEFETLEQAKARVEEQIAQLQDAVALYKAQVGCQGDCVIDNGDYCNHPEVRHASGRKPCEKCWYDHYLTKAKEESGG